MSGKNQPYEPESVLYPELFLLVLTLPADPDTNWNTLPASLNTTELTTYYYQLKKSLAPFVSNKVVEPGSNDSL
jgi:hypothetical protein